MGNLSSNFARGQSPGVSPSSTEESNSKNLSADPPVSENGKKTPVSNGEEKESEEPESNDTSYGVEATAVRALAASTGTVAILATTAKVKDEENEQETEAESDEDGKIEEHVLAVESVEEKNKDVGGKGAVETSDKDIKKEETNVPKEDEKISVQAGEDETEEKETKHLELENAESAEKETDDYIPVTVTELENESEKGPTEVEDKLDSNDLNDDAVISGDSSLLTEEETEEPLVGSPVDVVENEEQPRERIEIDFTHNLENDLGSGSYELKSNENGYEDMMKSEGDGTGSIGISDDRTPSSRENDFSGSEPKTAELTTEKNEIEHYSGDEFNTAINNFKEYKTEDDNITTVSDLKSSSIGRESEEKTKTEEEEESKSISSERLQTNSVSDVSVSESFIVELEDPNQKVDIESAGKEDKNKGDKKNQQEETAPIFDLCTIEEDEATGCAMELPEKKTVAFEENSVDTIENHELENEKGSGGDSPVGLTDSMMENVKEQVEEICNEAVEKTQSIICSPTVDEKELLNKSHSVQENESTENDNLGDNENEPSEVAKEDKQALGKIGNIVSSTEQPNNEEVSETVDLTREIINAEEKRPVIDSEVLETQKDSLEKQDATTVECNQGAQEQSISNGNENIPTESMAKSRDTDTKENLQVTEEVKPEVSQETETKICDSGINETSIEKSYTKDKGDSMEGQASVEEGEIKIESLDSTETPLAESPEETTEKKDTVKSPIMSEEDIVQKGAPLENEEVIKTIPMKEVQEELDLNIRTENAENLKVVEGKMEEEADVEIVIKQTEVLSDNLDSGKATETAHLEEITTKEVNEDNLNMEDKENEIKVLPTVGSTETKDSLKSEDSIDIKDNTSIGEIFNTNDSKIVETGTEQKTLDSLESQEQLKEAPLVKNQDKMEENIPAEESHKEEKQAPVKEIQKSLERHHEGSITLNDLLNNEDFSDNDEVTREFPPPAPEEEYSVGEEEELPPPDLEALKPDETEWTAIQRPTECPELPHQDPAIAATTIQAGVRGYLTRKHVEEEKKRRLEEKKKGAKDEDEAAKKIQAGVRGYLTRKRLGEGDPQRTTGEYHDSVPLSPLPLSNAEAVGEEMGKRKEPDSREEAATRIQSTFRGYKTRRDMKKAEGEEEVPPEECEASGAEDSVQNESATKIQAGIRGYLVRKRQKAEREAATKIQAGFRGFKVRQQIKQNQK